MLRDVSVFGSQLFLLTKIYLPFASSNTNPLESSRLYGAMMNEQLQCNLFMFDFITYTYLIWWEINHLRIDIILILHISLFQTKYYQLSDILYKVEYYNIKHKFDCKYWILDYEVNYGKSNMPRLLTYILCNNPQYINIVGRHPSFIIALKSRSHNICVEKCNARNIRKNSMISLYVYLYEWYCS